MEPPPPPNPYIRFIQLYEQVIQVEGGDIYENLVLQHEVQMNLVQYQKNDELTDFIQNSDARIVGVFLCIYTNEMNRFNQRMN